MVKKVKIGLAKSIPKYKCFRADDTDTLFFEEYLVIPKVELRKVIMDEAHNFLLSMHPGVGERSMGNKKFPTHTQYLSMVMIIYERGE